MSGRRIHVSLASELFSPDQRTGAGDRIHHARKLRRLTTTLRRLWLAQSGSLRGASSKKRVQENTDPIPERSDWQKVIQAVENYCRDYFPRMIECRVRLKR
jgi:hypothetical protein